MRAHLVLLIAVASCGGEVRPVAVPRQLDRSSPVDVESRNLPPAEELDALLKGVSTFGRAVDTRRIAVVPFEAAGVPPDKAWIGEAIAEVVAGSLSRIDGISVLDREQVRTLIADRAEGARALGVNAIVTGTVRQAGGGWVAIARPIREDGVAMSNVQVEIGTSDMNRALQPVVRQVATLVGRPVIETASVEPLPQAKLELAARARALQYAGKLAAAQPLYEQALATPSSAWRLEADYLRLMSDLGMTAWSEARATQVLARMPKTPELLCDRARVLIEKSRHAASVPDLRESIRTAASCGDKALIAQALADYGAAMTTIDAAMATEALRRARDTLGTAVEWAWVRCRIDYLTEVEAQNQGKWTEPREQRLLVIAKACEKAGNLRVAAAALHEAAPITWLPKTRVELAKRAFAIAGPVGGTQLDTARLDHADRLREYGRPTEADDLLLAMIGDRLGELIKLHGALPAPSDNLDQDLLRRANVTVPAGRLQPLEPDAQLAAAVHAKALARGLRAWAARTRTESIKQAELYVEIADTLDPAGAQLDDPSIAELEKRLVQAKLVLDDIETKPAPLRASGANLDAAWNTLWRLYWKLQSDKAGADKLRRISAAVTKVAGWWGNQRARWNSERLRGRVELDIGSPTAALTIYRSLVPTLSVNARQTSMLLDMMLEIEDAGSDEARRLRRAAIDANKRVSPEDWIDAVEADADASKQAAWDESVKQLVAVADDLEASGAWEAAARALAKAATISKDGQHAEGTKDAVELYERRVKLLDRLDDPIRAALARAEMLYEIGRYKEQVFRGNATKAMRSDPKVRALYEDLTSKSRALATSGRYRDAARIVASLDLEAAPDERLSVEALEWVEKLEDSVEYPNLAARLHVRRAWVLTDKPAQIAEFEKAVTLFVRANDIGEATFNQRRILRFTYDEAALWKAYDRCREIAGDKIDRVDCVFGIGEGINEYPRRSLREVARLKKAAALGFAALSEIDGSYYAAADKQEFRTYLAMVAAVAGDHDMVRRVHEGVRDYYTTQHPDPYQYATHVDRLITTLRGAARNAPDVASIALQLAREFATSKGPSDFWRATTYWTYADIARLAGDAGAAKEFDTRGRALARALSKPSLVYYDLVAAKAGLERKDWRGAAGAYATASQTATTYNVDSPAFAWELRLASAVASALAKDTPKARTTIAPLVAKATAMLDGSEPPTLPCLHARVLEVAASIELAGGSCPVGTKLREQAEAMRTRCTGDSCLASWCEEKDYADWKGRNACAQPFSGTTDMLPVY